MLCYYLLNNYKFSQPQSDITVLPAQDLRWCPSSLELLCLVCAFQHLLEWDWNPPKPPPDSLSRPETSRAESKNHIRNISNQIHSFLDIKYQHLLEITSLFQLSTGISLVTLNKQHKKSFKNEKRESKKRNYHINLFLPEWSLNHTGCALC